MLELAGRVIKVEKLRYSREDLPHNLVRYLDSAQRCVNPKCKGVWWLLCVVGLKNGHIKSMVNPRDVAGNAEEGRNQQTQHCGFLSLKLL